MTALSDILVLLLVLTNFRLLATSRLAVAIQTVAYQALLLSVILLTESFGHWTAQLLSVAIATPALKGWLMPWLMRRAMRQADVNREIEPFIGFSASVLIGAVLLGLCFVVTSPLKASVPTHATLLMPAAMFAILCGLLVIIARKKALMQVVGYVAMENGIYAFGTALAVEAPMLVELGVLLDLFVAIFIMGIAINHISREFDHIDTDRLSQLKDWPS